MFFLKLYQSPQLLLSQLILFKNRKNIKDKVSIKINKVLITLYRINNLGYAVSLGTNILIDSKLDSKHLFNHEYGHTKQSLMLGPLYLPLVGLPSATINLLTRFNILDKENYYTYYPENWADQLGGVNRKSPSIPSA